jgi:hypothetical protein
MLNRWAAGFAETHGAGARQNRSGLVIWFLDPFVTAMIDRFISSHLGARFFRYGGVRCPSNYDHIVVVVEENRPASEIYGNRVEAPYLNQLKDRGAWLSRMSAITHPSQPNYCTSSAGVGKV